MTDQKASEIRNLDGHDESKKITRRQFIAGASALGLSAALSPALVPSSAFAAQGPQKGGHFKMGMAGGHTTDSLDTALIADQVADCTNYALRNNLVEVDHKGNAVPELAESWDASKDAATWHFNLRKGVEFHNGKTMDSEDVIFSIRHHMGKDSKSGAKGLINQIEDIKKDGKDKVVFTLKTGNADFPYILNDYHLTIVPAGTQGEQWEKGIGTGGYILEAWEPGVKSIVRRNPNYYKSDRAHFESAEVLSIADTNARTNALRTGQVDYMNRVELKTIHLFQRAKNINIIQVNGGYHYTLAMLTDTPPYDNNDVRLALKYAIDREELVKKFLRGYGSVGNDQPIHPGNRFYANDLPQRQYDPDKAKFHLKKAGLSQHTFDLHTSEHGGFMDISTLYQQSAAKAGIKINMVKEPEDGYWSNVWLNKAFCHGYWGARPTADMAFSVAYSGKAKWNETRLQNKRLDELVLAARSELDDAKRKEMYRECQMIIRDEGGTIVPFFKDYVEASNEKIGHGTVSGLWESDAHRVIERWWFKS
ncbi:peptide/nickel transport system substrate-binding protein [Desulfocicer vacuolatum DSM 3385]|uniref:Peptide/nickel transport system substrate-binding protein n=1 Tax=Desulfocicer vacuolatum DSM 3385 TaxID=1121400 RepID=A0A1W2DX58_9BACT|nr:ABC transporter substrate-binding protein [Desulfocicer vacuolatum]SMD01702.1 peptide/nickel transport system substrate-binding protein [Desulfocicer vacuolatum DSM 3385]